MNDNPLKVELEALVERRSQLQADVKALTVRIQVLRKAVVGRPSLAQLRATAHDRRVAMAAELAAGATRAEVAKEYGISTERVNQLMRQHARVLKMR